ncbi:MAG: RDD family protein [Candidatus Moraniibacteriota bacterium]
MENQNGFQDPNQMNVATMESQPVAQPVAAGMAPVATQMQVRYAGFWIRFAAAFIDGLVLSIPQAIVRVFVTVANFGEMYAITSSVLSCLVTWAYYVLMTNNYQATLGKKAVGIRVLSGNLERLTLNQVLLRETVGKLVSMLIIMIGYIMAGFTEKKRALHDIIANTVVVYNDQNK